MLIRCASERWQRLREHRHAEPQNLYPRSAKQRDVDRPLNGSEGLGLKLSCLSSVTNETGERVKRSRG